MKRQFFFWAVIALLTACSGSKENSSDTAIITGEGGRVYGGAIHISTPEQIGSVAPYNLLVLSAANLSTQLFEGLTRLSPKDLSVQPLLAEKWEVDPAGTSYTFYLKKDVFFHDNACFKDGKGKQLTAHDVAYTFKKVCSDFPGNNAFNSTLRDILVGANEFFQASSSESPLTEIAGFKIVDDYTFQLTLQNPNPLFLSILASPVMGICSEEADKMYGLDNKVGTGPFVYHHADENRLVLVKNASYHGTDELGNKLPFTDSLLVHYIESKKIELDWFENDKLDLVIGLPSESIKDIVEKQIANFENRPPKYVLSRNPEMATQYYEFNLQKPHFKNVKVRQAFNYAINREKIITDILKGEAYGPGIYGITPPTFKGYDITRIKGYDYNPEKARTLLAEAGFPGGKGFPVIKLELNSGGSKNVNVAFEIQKQLESTLGVKIDIEVVSLQQKIEDAKYGRADIFRSAWIADYPSPDNFLYLLYGKNVPASPDQPSYPNVMRYVNKDFDALYEKGRILLNDEERFETFYKAEQLAMDDAPVMVVWYDEKYTLQKARLQNYFSNPMNIKYFADVFLKTPVAEQKSAAK